MRAAGTRRAIALAIVALAPACAAVLDLPDPKLDNAVGAADGGNGPDGTVLGDGGPNDGAGDAPIGDGGLDACDLTDAANCGACGNDCSNGICQPGGVCLLADRAGQGSFFLYGPQEIAIYDGVVYATYTTNYESGIVACPTSGCKQEGGVQDVVFLDGSSRQAPSSLAVDDAGALFWLSYDGADAGGLYQTDRDSGATTFLNANKTVDYAYDLVVAGNQLVFTADTNYGGAFNCAKTGLCSGTPIAALGTYGRGVAITDYGVAWTMNQSLYICATPDCASGAHRLGDGDYPLAAAGPYLYYSPFSGTLERVRLDVDGGVGEPVADKPSSGFYNSLLLVNGMLYFSNAGTEPDDGGVTTDGTVKKCSPDNCAATTVDVAVGQAAPSSLRTDGRSIYWVNQGLATQTSQPGSIMKAPL